MRRAPLLVAACAAACGAAGARAPAPVVEIYAAGDAPRIALADLDGDGARDLVVAFSGRDRGVDVRRGDAVGGFGEARRALVGDVSFAVARGGGAGADLVVGDGQHLGVLPGGRGPLRVLAASPDRVLGAIASGVLTTDGSDLRLHAWQTAEERPLEVAPLAPAALEDLDGDGLADLVGRALGRAVVRRGTEDGFAPARVLGEAEGLATADVDGDGRAEIVAWSGGVARAWRADGGEVASFPVPLAASALAAGDLDGDARPEIVVAAGAAIEVVGGARVDGPWSDVRALVVDAHRLLVADAGARVVAVVRGVRGPGCGPLTSRTRGASCADPRE